MFYYILLCFITLYNIRILTRVPPPAPLFLPLDPRLPWSFVKGAPHQSLFLLLCSPPPISLFAPRSPIPYAVNPRGAVRVGESGGNQGMIDFDKQCVIVERGVLMIYR